MSKRIRPLGLHEFPSISTNCFGFALGITNPVSKSESIYNLDHNFPIPEAFLQKVDELGYDLKQLRQINSINEAHDDEFVIKVFDFKPFQIRRPFVGWTLYWTYHVVRRELDGTWVHKQGWDEPPCEIHDKDWPEIHKEFGKQYVLFALAATTAE